MPASNTGLAPLLLRGGKIGVYFLSRPIYSLQAGRLQGRTSYPIYSLQAGTPARAEITTH